MKKIVIVDDYIDFVENLGEFIERFNDAKCVTFCSSSNALMYILNNKDVDILITDYEMPGMNGFMLAHRLAVIEELKLRIIICSGHDKRTLEEIRRQCDLEDKIEVICKTDMEFFKNLSN